MNQFILTSWVLTLAIAGLPASALAQSEPPTQPPTTDPSAPPVPPDAEGDDEDEGEETEPTESAPAEAPAPDAPGTEPTGTEPPAEDSAESVPAEEKPAADEALGDDDLEAEEGEGEGEEPSKPPAAGKGVLWGVIKDTEFSEPLIEAPVQVVGTKIEALTDEEGRFRLELPPGTYTIRVAYELHKTQRVDRVVVAAGKVVRLDLQLVPDEAATEEFEIVEEADKASLEGIILARQRASVASDSIGRSEISKSTDRNAAQAAQRIVGANVVGGRFVYVRGLGERYTNARINGVPLPSPEPDRAAVPLDLFPAGLLQSLQVIKMFSPDMPGDFAGGSVLIETREIPNEPFLQLSARAAYNSESTFRERLSSRGGDLDWLGIDDGMRALPDNFPGRSLDPTTETGGDPVTNEERTAAGLAINSYMSAQRSGTPPSFSVSAVGGKSWDLGENRKLGVVGSLSYGQGYTARRNEVLRLFKTVTSKEDPRGITPLRDYRATTGNVNVNWGGFASATYRFSPHHRVSLTGLRSTLADNRTQYITGSHAGRMSDVHVTRLGFVTRALNLGILSGEHLIPALGSAELDWNLVLSSASRDEPDRRDVVWEDGVQTPAREYRFSEAPESGRHFFSEQTEKQLGGGVDWSQPIGGYESKLKFGGLASLRDRNFTSRTLRFRRFPGTRSDLLVCQPGQLDACNDALFRPENIGTVLQLEEMTAAQDSYDATLNVFSGYAMADLGLGPQVRVVAGLRFEHTYQTIDPYDRYQVGAAPEDLKRARIDQTNGLPALIATWSPTKKTKLRAAVTRTLARPQLRELAPFGFVDYFGGPYTSGNPDLKLTRVTNVDTRLEHFPTLKDVLAFSLFFKDFRDPIESVILESGDEGAVTFANARGAKLIGVEFEARRGLEFLSRSLADLMVVTNLTLAHSRIEIPTGGTIDLTNPSRPLVNQAPWVFNLALDYTSDLLSARLLYNVVGPRVSQAGAKGLDDVYEHPRAMLDLSVQKKFFERLSVKLEGSNLLNSEVLQTQGCGGDGLFGSTWHLSCSNGDDEAVSRYREGVTVALGASYEF